MTIDLYTPQSPAPSPVIFPLYANAHKHKYFNSSYVDKYCETKYINGEKREVIKAIIDKCKKALFLRVPYWQINIIPEATEQICDSKYHIIYELALYFSTYNILMVNCHTYDGHTDTIHFYNTHRMSDVKHILKCFATPDLHLNIARLQDVKKELLTSTRNAAKLPCETELGLCE